MKFNSKFYARFLTVSVESNSEQLSTFMRANHVQGGINTTFNIVLKLNNEILQCLQFTISGDTAILNRNASKTNTVIVGGFSRLLHRSKKFLSSLGVTKIVTYANRDLTPEAKDA